MAGDSNEAESYEKPAGDTSGKYGGDSLIWVLVGSNPNTLIPKQAENGCKRP